jgi:hypothetical protein
MLGTDGSDGGYSDHAMKPNQISDDQDNLRQGSCSIRSKRLCGTFIVSKYCTSPSLGERVWDACPRRPRDHFRGEDQTVVSQASLRLQTENRRFAHLKTR